MAQQQLKIFVSLHFLLIIGICLRSAIGDHNIEKCPDTLIYLEEGEERYVSSDSYEQPCALAFKAPMDHEIQVKCRLSLDKDCQKESFYFADDIHLPVADYEKFCAEDGNYFDRTSKYGTIILELLSNSTGSYDCILDVVPIDGCSCGQQADNTNIDSSLENPSILSIIQNTTPESQVAIFSIVLCAAAIVAHSYLLTSATCVRDVSKAQNIAAFDDYRQYEGKFNINAYVHFIDNVLKHPDYNPNTKLNDIAVLRTAKPIEWTLRIAPICLPDITFLLNTLTTIEIVNYGIVQQKTQEWKKKLDIIPYDECQSGTIGQICINGNTNEQEVCQYDGPIIYNYTLIGIMGNEDCGYYPPYGEYEMVHISTSIFPHLRWVYDVTLAGVCIFESE